MVYNMVVSIHGIPRGRMVARSLTIPEGAEIYWCQRHKRAQQRQKTLRLEFILQQSACTVKRIRSGTHEDIQSGLEGMVMLAGTILPIFYAFRTPLKHN